MQCCPDVVSHRLRNLIAAAEHRSKNEQLWRRPTKTRIVLPLLFLIGLTMTVPAVAGVVYENGPINGNTNAWMISDGFVVGDSFTVSGGATTITGVAFGVWVSPDDPLTSVEVSLNSQPNLGGTTYFDEMINFTKSDCTVNYLGFHVCTETGLFNGPTLPNGTYWMSLENARTLGGDPAYWDENSGVGCQSPGCPSQVWRNNGGTIPSESFSILGNQGGSTPEPDSLILFASGLLAMAGVIRRIVL